MQDSPGDDFLFQQKLGDRSFTVDKISDETLMRAITLGANWALEVLYQRYYRLLFSLCYHMTQNRQTTEDLLQETLLSVWKNASLYSSTSGSVRSWLVSIIRHRTIDLLRRQNTRQEQKIMPLDDLIYDENLVSSDAWDETWQAVQGDSIRKALLTLSSEQRFVIEQAYFQGLSHSEIAASYHIPLGTVKARMRLGLQHLKKILVQMGVEL